MLNTVGEASSRNASPASHSRAQTPPENPFADPQNPFADPEKGVAGPPSGPGPRSAPMGAPAQIAPPVAPNPDRIAFTGSWPAAPSGYDTAQESQRDMPTEEPRGMPKSSRGPVSEPDDLPIMGAPTPKIPMPSPAASSPTAASSGIAAASAAAGAAAVGVAAGAAAAASSSKKQERRPEPLRTQPQQQPREEPREQPREEPRESPRKPPREAPREAVPSPGPAPSPAFAGAASDVPSSPAPSAASSQTSAQNGGNVYRVLMDFAPSMDDELELKSGQLVRMLHEYDDGWVSVRYLPKLSAANSCRLSASDSIAPNKVSSLVPALLPSHRSLSHLISASMLAMPVPKGARCPRRVTREVVRCPQLEVATAQL